MADSEEKTIISLFAHPDDELGAIGTLANHARRGDRVIVAWTTKGELTTHLKDFSPEEIKKIRVEHGKAVNDIIGGEKAHFFDFGDSRVSNSREQRVEVAKFYAKEKPNAIISWGLFNSHSDHKNTGYLALEAIQAARISAIVGEDPHRKGPLLFQYFEKQNNFPIQFVNVKESFDKIMEVVNYYADVYKWEHAEKWIKSSLNAKGMEANCEYAEKFNIRFKRSKAPEWVF